VAFELTDHNRSYVKKGELRGLFNVLESDETLDEIRYYQYQNENGAYVIQRVTTVTTLTVKVYRYYARKASVNAATDWTKSLPTPLWSSQV